MLSQEFSQISLKMQGFDQYMMGKSMQFWSGFHGGSVQSSWCYLITECGGQQSVRVLQGLFQGLRTGISQVSEQEVVDAMAQREVILWCFMERDRIFSAEQVSQLVIKEDVVSVVRMEMAKTQTTVVCLPTVSEIIASAEIKRKLWQYFLHLK